jgi:hypothetical protein
MECGEWQNGKIHDLFYGTSKKQATYQGMFDQKSEPLTGGVVNGGGGTGDEKVQDDT